MKYKCEKDAYEPEVTEFGFAIRSREQGIIEPGQSKAFDTGLGVEFTYTTGIIFPNPKLDLKNKITSIVKILPSIDYDITVRLYNHSNVSFNVKKGTIIGYLKEMPF